MSEREQAKSIIDRLPEYKIGNLLLFLQGMLFDDEIEDNLYCERLAEAYLNDASPDKHETSCCNYDCGNCLLLDNGEECVCPQSITYSLVCR